MSRCPVTGQSRTGTVDSDTWSSLCGLRNRGVCSLNAVFARFATVSVTAQKCGGGSTQLIGKTRGNATRVLPSVPGGRHTPKRRYIIWGQANAIKTIRYVDLHHVDGPMMGVRIVHTLQDSLQGMAKLHLIRCQTTSGFIDPTLGVVNDNEVLAVPLGD